MGDSDTVDGVSENQPEDNLQNQLPPVLTPESLDQEPLDLSQVPFEFEVPKQPEDFSGLALALTEPSTDDNYNAFADQLIQLNKVAVPNQILSSFWQAAKEGKIGEKYSKALAYSDYSPSAKDIAKYRSLYAKAKEDMDVGGMIKYSLGSTFGLFRNWLEFAAGMDAEQAEKVSLGVQSKNLIGEIGNREEAQQALTLGDYYYSQLKNGESISPKNQEPSVKMGMSTYKGVPTGVKVGMNLKEAEDYLRILENSTDKNPTSPVLRTFAVAAGNALPFVTIGNIVVDDEKDPEQVAKRAALISRINEVVEQDYYGAEMTGMVAGSLGGFVGAGKLATGALGRSIDIAGKSVKIPTTLSRAATYTLYSAGQDLKQERPFTWDTTLLNIAESSLELGLSESLGDKVEDVIWKSSVNSGAAKYLKGLDPKISSIPLVSAKVIGSTAGEFTSNQIDRVYSGQDPMKGFGEDLATAFGAAAGMATISSFGGKYSSQLQQEYQSQVREKVRQVISNTFKTIRNRTDLTFRQKDAEIKRFIMSHPAGEVRDYLLAINVATSVDPAVSPQTAKAAKEAVQKTEEPALSQLIRGETARMEAQDKLDAQNQPEQQPQPQKTIEQSFILAAQILQDATDALGTAKAQSFEIDSTPENKAAIKILEDQGSIAFSEIPSPESPGKNLFKITGVISSEGKYYGDSKHKSKISGLGRKEKLISDISEAAHLTQEEKETYTIEVEEAVGDRQQTLNQKLDDIAKRAKLPEILSEEENKTQIENQTKANEEVALSNEMRKIDEQLPILEDQVKVVPVDQQPAMEEKIRDLKKRRLEYDDQKKDIERRAHESFMRDVLAIAEPTEQEILNAKVKNREDVLLDIYNPGTELGKKWIEASKKGPSAKEQDIEKLGENFDLNNEGVKNMLKTWGALDAQGNPLMSFNQALVAFKNKWINYYSNPESTGFQEFDPTRILDAVIDQARLISRTSDKTIPINDILQKTAADFMRQASLLKQANIGLAAALSLDLPTAPKLEAGVLVENPTALDQAAQDSTIVLGGRERSREEVEAMKEAISSARELILAEKELAIKTAKNTIGELTKREKEAVKAIQKAKTDQEKQTLKDAVQKILLEKDAVQQTLNKNVISKEAFDLFFEETKNTEVKIKELAKKFGLDTKNAATILQEIQAEIQSKAIDIQQDLMLQGKYKGIKDNIVMSPVAEITKEELHNVLSRFLYLKKFRYFQPGGYTDPETGQIVPNELDIYEPLVQRLNVQQTRKLYDGLMGQFDDIENLVLSKGEMDPYLERFRDNLDNFTAQSDLPQKFSLPKGKTDFYLKKLDDWGRNYNQALKTKNETKRKELLRGLRDEIIKLDEQFTVDIGGTYDKYGNIVLTGLTEAQPRADLGTPEGRVKSGIGAIERAASKVLEQTAGVSSKKSRAIKGSRELVAEPDASTESERGRSGMERSFGERIPKEFEIQAEQNKLDYSKNYPTFRKVFGPTILDALRPDQFEDSVASVVALTQTKHKSIYIANGAGTGKSRVKLAVGRFFNITDPNMKVIGITDSSAIDADYSANRVGGSLGEDAAKMGIQLEMRGKADGPPIESLPGKFMVTTYNVSYLKQLLNVVDKKTILLLDEFQIARSLFERITATTKTKEEAKKRDESSVAILLDKLIKQSGGVVMFSGTPYERPEQMLPMLSALGIVDNPKDAQDLFLRFGYEYKSSKERGYREKSWRRVRPDESILFLKDGSPRYSKTQLAKMEELRNSAKDRNDWDKVIEIDKILGVTRDDMEDRLEGFQGELSALGMFRSRFMRLNGIPVDRVNVELSKKFLKELDAVNKLHFGLQYTDADIGEKINQTARFLLEQERVKAGAKLGVEAILRGEKVVFFVESVQNTDKIIPGTMKTSTAALLRAALEDEFKRVSKRGETIKIAELFAKTDKNAAKESFQAQESQAIITNINLGGVGINLDDVTGKNPRHVIFLTAPYSAISLVQAIYRVWRYNTASIPRISIMESDTSSDQNTISRLLEKLSFLGASVPFGVTLDSGKQSGQKQIVEPEPEQIQEPDKKDPAQELVKKWIAEVKQAKTTKKVSELLTFFRGKINSLSPTDRRAAELFEAELIKPSISVEAQPETKAPFEPKVKLGKSKQIITPKLPFKDSKSFKEWLSKFQEFRTVKAAFDDIPLPILLKQLALADPSLDISKTPIKVLSLWDNLSEEDKKLESNQAKYLNPGMPFNKAPEIDKRNTLYSRVYPFFEAADKKQPKVNLIDDKKVKSLDVFDYRPSDATPEQNQILDATEKAFQKAFNYKNGIIFVKGNRGKTEEYKIKFEFNGLRPAAIVTQKDVYIGIDPKVLFDIYLKNETKEGIDKILKVVLRHEILHVKTLQWIEQVLKKPSVKFLTDLGASFSKEFSKFVSTLYYTSYGVNVYSEDGQANVNALANNPFLIAAEAVRLFMEVELGGEFTEFSLAMSDQQRLRALNRFRDAFSGQSPDVLRRVNKYLEGMQSSMEDSMQMLTEGRGKVDITEATEKAIKRLEEMAFKEQKTEVKPEPKKSDLSSMYNQYDDIVSRLVELQDIPQDEKTDEEYQEEEDLLRRKADLGKRIIDQAAKNPIQFGIQVPESGEGEVPDLTRKITFTDKHDLILARKLSDYLSGKTDNFYNIQVSKDMLNFGPYITAGDLNLALKRDMLGNVPGATFTINLFYSIYGELKNKNQVFLQDLHDRLINALDNLEEASLDKEAFIPVGQTLEEAENPLLPSPEEMDSVDKTEGYYFVNIPGTITETTYAVSPRQARSRVVFRLMTDEGKSIFYNGKVYEPGQEKVLLKALKENDPKGKVLYTTFVGNRMFFPEVPKEETEETTQKIRKSRAVVNMLAKAWALIPGKELKEQLASLVHYRQKSPKETIEDARNYINSKPLTDVTSEFLDGTLPFPDLETCHQIGFALQSIYLRRLAKGDDLDKELFYKIFNKTNTYYATSAGRIIQSYSARGGGPQASVENPVVWLNGIYNQLETAVRSVYEANDEEIEEIKQELTKAQWKAIESYFSKPETQSIMNSIMANQQKLQQIRETSKTLDKELAQAMAQYQNRAQALFENVIGKISFPGGEIPDAKNVKLDQDLLSGIADQMLQLAKELYPKIPNILDNQENIKQVMLSIPLFNSGPQAAEYRRLFNMHFSAAYGVVIKNLELEKTRQEEEINKLNLAVEEKQKKLEELKGSSISNIGGIGRIPEWPINIGDGESLGDDMERIIDEKSPVPVDSDENGAISIEKALSNAVIKSLKGAKPGVKSAAKAWLNEVIRRVRGRGREAGIIPAFKKETIGPAKQLKDLLARLPELEQILDGSMAHLRDNYTEEEILAVREIYDAVRERPFTLTSLSSVMRDISSINGPKMTIQNLIRSSVIQQSDYKEKLAEALIAETSLSPDTRNLIIDHIYNGVSELIEKKRREALVRLTDKYSQDKLNEKKTRKVKSALQKLVEMTRLGALSDNDILSAVRQEIGLPELGEEQRKKLQELVLDLDKYPEGFIRSIKESEVLEYIKFVAPIAYGELLVSYQTANVLVGPGTHAINFQSSALGGLMDTTVFATWLRNSQISNLPKDISKALVARASLELKNSMFNPDGAAIQSALNIWKTGMFPADSNMVHSLGKVQIFEAMAREGEAARKGLRGDNPVEMTILLPSLGDLVPGIIKTKNWYKKLSQTVSNGFGLASQWTTQHIPFFQVAKDKTGKIVRLEQKDKGKVLIINLKPSWLTEAQIKKISEMPGMTWLDKKLGGKLIPSLGKFGNLPMLTPSLITPFVFSGRLMTGADAYNKTNVKKFFEIIEAGYLAVKNLVLRNEELKANGQPEIEITEELVLTEVDRLLNRTPERIDAARRLAAKDAKRYNLSKAQEVLRFEEILEFGRPSTEETEELKKRVNLLARRLTYQADFEGWIGLVLGQVDRFAKYNWIPGSIFKFMRTSSNIANSWLDYLPLVNAIRMWRGLGGMLAGTPYYRPPPVKGSVEYDLAVSKLWASSSILSILGMLLAAAYFEDRDNPFFTMHFRGPTEPTKRKAFFAAKGIPRSIQIGKFGRPWLFGLMKAPLFISWETLPPQMTGILMPLAVASETVRYSGRGAAESTATSLAATAISTSLGVMDLSMLQNMRGLMQVINPTNSPQGILQAAAQLSGGVFASYIPYYPILRDVEMTVNAVSGNPNSKLHKDGILSYFLSSIPFVSRFGDPDLDFLGGNVQPKMTNNLPIIRRYFRIGVSIEGYDDVENPSEQAIHDKLISLFARNKKVINWDAGTLHDMAMEEYLIGVAMGKPSDISPYQLMELKRDLTDNEKYEWVKRAGPLIQAELAPYIPRLDVCRDSAEFQYIIDRTNVNKIKRMVLRQILEEQNQLNIMNSDLP